MADRKKLGIIGCILSGATAVVMGSVSSWWKDT
jgi:hypothetical protein